MICTFPSLLLIMANIAGASPVIENGQVYPIPSCGFCSAYSFLYCLEHPANVDSLREAFGDVDVSGALSVADLREALARVGVETEAVAYSPHDSHRLPTPSILYISPGRWPQRNDMNVGHFVTLVKYVDDQAVILDWSGMTVEPAVHLPASELAKYWDGDAIVTVPRRWPSYVGLCLAALCFALFRKHIPRVLVLAGVAVTLGCSTKSQPEVVKSLNPTLVFHQPLGKLGEVTATSMKAHDFEFRVWDQSSVVIRSVEASCGCTVPDKSLLDRELSAGSTHKLHVSIRVDGNVSTQAKSLRVVTDPPSPVPMVLAVSYTRRDPPQLSVNRLLVEANPENYATGEVRVTYHRPVSEPALKLEKERSSFGDFSLTETKQDYEKIVSNQATGETIGSDTIRLQFRASAHHSYGTRDSEMKLAFTDGSTQVLATRIVVPHPISTSSDRIFAGVMLPGEVREKTIRVKAPTDSDSLTVSHADGMISYSSVVADTLTIRIVAPQEFGRHEALVTLTSGSIPPLTIPVVCVVKRK